MGWVEAGHVPMAASYPTHIATMPSRRHGFSCDAAAQLHACTVLGQMLGLRAVGAAVAIALRPFRSHTPAVAASSAASTLPSARTEESSMVRCFSHGIDTWAPWCQSSLHPRLPHTWPPFFICKSIPLLLCTCVLLNSYYPPTPPLRTLCPWPRPVKAVLLKPVLTCQVHATPPSKERGP